MTVTITGASDDLIEIGGGIQEEFAFYFRDDNDKCYVAVSDGTLISAVYDRNGIWRFHRVMAGSAKFSKVEGDAEADTNDVVTLDGNIKWVTLATEFAKA